MDDTIKYSIKFLALTGMLALILKFMLQHKTMDSILIAMLITVSLFCVENILELNQTSANPADCTKCDAYKENFDNALITDTPNGAVPAPPLPTTTQPPIPTTTQPPTYSMPIGTKVENEVKLNQELIQQEISDEIKNGGNLDSGYVTFDTTQLRKLDDKQVEQANLFRMQIGNQNVVSEYLLDGKAYYDKLYTNSTNAPIASKLINNELSYGDYNYIGPLNAGMINPSYTYISPSNWYPIPPFPPVSVGTNPSIVTAIINDNGNGNNYMNFANLKDFDKTSRFTGNQNINIEYIKKFLNNSESCN